MNEKKVFSLDFPADYQALDVARSSVRSILEHAPDALQNETLCYNIQLAVHEILTNIIEHAYQGLPGGRIQMALALESDGRSLQVEIWDQGLSFDPTSIPEPDLENPMEHGYGLFLARSLMDEVVYNPQADGNHWRLSKILA